MHLILASGNADKKREIDRIIAEASPGAYVTTMREEGLDLEIEETGTTFEENALLKARAVHDALMAASPGTDAIVLADDSGLEVDAMGGEPGVFSSRFLGEDTSYETKNGEILRRLEGLPDEQRGARFVCAVACVFPGGSSHCVRETMEGRIARSPEGSNGFGYDPIFCSDGKNVTNGCLSPEEKNRISHRGKAFRAMIAYLAKP